MSGRQDRQASVSSSATVCEREVHSALLDAEENEQDEKLGRGGRGPRGDFAPPMSRKKAPVDESEVLQGL